MSAFGYSMAENAYLETENMTENFTATFSNPRIITFNTTSKVYSTYSHPESPAARVEATIRTVPSNQESIPTSQQTKYTLMYTNTLKTPMYVCFATDTFFFHDNNAFEALFDCASNPLEYPYLAHKYERSTLFRNIRHLAIGGMLLTPVMIETLECFENLESLRIDSRIIIRTTATETMRAVEQSFTVWLQAQLRRRGFGVPLIQWVWDVGYWINRRSILAEQEEERNVVDGAVFEQGSDRGRQTSFTLQCLDPDNRSFLPHNRAVYHRRSWYTTASARF